MKKLLQPFLSIRNNLELIMQFSRREILSRYRGSFLGFIWSLINPLMMLTVYTFVFSVVFKGKWGQNTSDNPYEFALIMFCGIIVFNIFSETVNRAPSLIVSNVNYVKKVVFPLEIFPISVMISVLIHSIISLFILILGIYFLLGIISWTIILIPIFILPLLFFSLGLSWTLASLGVFIRDVGYGIGILTNMLFFITPIFYPISAVPKFLHPYMYLNPLTNIVDDFRKIVIWGQIPDWRNYIIVLVASIFVFYLGYGWFIKTRKGFADVL